jgi:hypothetical protein
VLSQWHLQAACRGQGPDEFVRGPNSDYGSARELCLMCPVRTECLEFALKDQSLNGLWGGDHRFRAAAHPSAPGRVGVSQGSSWSNASACSSMTPRSSPSRATMTLPSPCSVTVVRTVSAIAP